MARYFRQQAITWCNVEPDVWGHIDGILPKGPYPPCLRMADRTLLQDTLDEGLQYVKPRCNLHYHVQCECRRFYCHACLCIYLITWSLPLTEHHSNCHIKTLSPIQNYRHFADDNFKCILFNENVRIPLRISQQIVSESLVDYKSAFGSGND